MGYRGLPGKSAIGLRSMLTAAPDLVLSRLRTCSMRPRCRTAERLRQQSLYLNTASKHLARPPFFGGAAHMEIGEFGVGRPDFGGRRPRGEALGQKKRVPGLGFRRRRAEGACRPCFSARSLFARLQQRPLGGRDMRSAAATATGLKSHEPAVLTPFFLPSTTD